MRANHLGDVAHEPQRRPVVDGAVQAQVEQRILGRERPDCLPGHVERLEALPERFGVEAVGEVARRDAPVKVHRHLHVRAPVADVAVGVLPGPLERQVEPPRGRLPRAFSHRQRLFKAVLLQEFGRRPDVRAFHQHIQVAKRAERDIPVRHRRHDRAFKRHARDATLLKARQQRCQFARQQQGPAKMRVEKPPQLFQKRRGDAVRGLRRRGCGTRAVAPRAVRQDSARRPSPAPGR